MPLAYFILEHDRRGTLREIDSDWRDGKRIDIPRFSLTGSRSDPDKTMLFPTLEEAIRMRIRVIETTSIKMNSLRIRRSSDFKALCFDCNRWCDQWHEHKNSCPVYRAEVERHLR